MTITVDNDLLEQLNQIIEKYKIELGLKNKYIEELEETILRLQRKSLASHFAPGNCL